MKPQGLLSKTPGAGFLKMNPEDEDDPHAENLEDALQRKRDKLTQKLDQKVSYDVPRTGGT